MTLSYWNTQFQFTKLLPDFQDRLDLMAERSKATQITGLPIPYGPHARQVFELMGTPTPGGILPVFIHGGYWRALTAEMHRFVLPSLAGPEGAVANLEYRLLPDVQLVDIIEDTLLGLRALAHHTGCRLVVIGHSAGGHLALMGAQHLPQIVVGAVGVSGLYDLTPLQWSFLREEVGLKASDIEGHSPLALWSQPSADHVLVAVGAQETPEFHRQAHLFASTHGAKLLTVSETDHMTVLDALADPASALSLQIQSLIESARGGCASISGP